MTVRQNLPPSSAKIYLPNLSGGMQLSGQTEGTLQRRRLDQILRKNNEFITSRVEGLPPFWGVLLQEVCKKISVVISK